MGVKAKKSLCILLAFCVLFALYPNGVYATPETPRHIEANEELEVIHFTDDFLMSASEHRFYRVPIDDLLQYVEAGGQIYQEFRVHYEYDAVPATLVPVQLEDIELVSSIQRGDIPPVAANPFPVTQIRYSGRTHADSIVIVLMGDGFTAEEYGTWPNPAPRTVLWHANEVINTMLDIHPFNYFTDLFTVYVIHTTMAGQVSGVDGYLGTVMPDGTLVPSSQTNTRVRRTRITELANTVATQGNQTMIQVISNTQCWRGFAWMGWHYTQALNIGVNSVINTVNNPGGGFNVHFPPGVHWGTQWHGIFVHEVGHAFAVLDDEHGQNDHYDWRRVNRTREPNTNIKWAHWFGRRYVSTTPWRGTPDGSAVTVQQGCMMWGFGLPNRNFCGPCAAETTRRLAHISGETFHGRSPNMISAANPIPHTPTVTMPTNATRILDSAFHGNTTLNTIHIPSSVTTIGDFAFIGATGLRTIINHSTNPQQINLTTFAGVNRTIVDVWIPFGTTSAYRAAGWESFNLIEIPDTITGLTAYPANIAPEGGSSTITATGNGINPSQIRIAAFLNNTGNALYMQQPTGTASSVNATLNFPANMGNISRIYTIKVSIDGGSTWLPTPVATATVNAIINIGTINEGEGGRGWSFSSNVLRIYDGADVIITGTVANGRRIVVNTNATATVVLRNVSITGLTTANQPALALSNGANLTLHHEGTNVLTGANQGAGIHVPTNTILTIESGTGTLTATGGNFAAGIGSNAFGGVGEINIMGGDIRARGFASGAGIGGSHENTGSVITISGGTIYARGSANGTAGAPGIGSGSAATGVGGVITITGGNITAVAGNTTASALGRTTSGVSCTVTVTGEYRFWTNTTTVDPGGAPTVTGVFNNNPAWSFVRLEKIVTTLNYVQVLGSVLPAGVNLILTLPGENRMIKGIPQNVLTSTVTNLHEVTAVFNADSTPRNPNAPIGSGTVIEFVNGTRLTVIVFGDVDGNGVIDLIDVFRLEQHLAGHPIVINMVAADVNDDNAVNLFDVFRLRQFLAGHPVPLGPQPALMGAMSAPNNTGNVRFSVSETDANIGEYVDIVISIDENPGLALIHLMLHYDSAKFEMVGIASGLSSQFAFIQPAQTANPLPLMFSMTGDSNVHEVGTLATVRFRVADNAVLGVSPFVLGHEVITDTELSTMFVTSIVNGAVNIIASDVTNEEPAPEVVPDIDEEQSSETAPDVDEESLPETTPDIDEEQTPEMAPDTDEEQSSETTLDVDEESLPETTPDIDEEQTSEMAPDTDEEQLPEIVPDVEYDTIFDISPDAEEELTQVIMPELETILSSTFTIILSNIGGSAVGYGTDHEEATEGHIVTIHAGTNLGYEFAYWSSDVGVIFTDVNSPNTTFVMLDRDVVITANWRRIENVVDFTHEPSVPLEVYSYPKNYFEDYEQLSYPTAS